MIYAPSAVKTSQSYHVIRLKFPKIAEIKKECFVILTAVSNRDVVSQFCHTVCALQHLCLDTPQVPAQVFLPDFPSN